MLILEYVLANVYGSNICNCASVDEIQEGGMKVLGDSSRRKTSDLKLENVVPTGKYF